VTQQAVRGTVLKMVMTWVDSGHCLGVTEGLEVALGAAFKASPGLGRRVSDKKSAKHTDGAV
jgi:hypothetical protein